MFEVSNIHVDTQWKLATPSGRHVFQLTQFAFNYFIGNIVTISVKSFFLISRGGSRMVNNNLT